MRRGDEGQQGFEKGRIERIAHAGPSTTSRSGRSGRRCVWCVLVYKSEDGSQFSHWFRSETRIVLHIHIHIFIWKRRRQRGLLKGLALLRLCSLLSVVPSSSNSQLSLFVCVSHTPHLTPYSLPHSNCSPHHAFVFILNHYSTDPLLLTRPCCSQPACRPPTTPQTPPHLSYHPTRKREGRGRHVD